MQLVMKSIMYLLFSAQLITIIATIVNPKSAVILANPAYRFYKLGDDRQGRKSGNAEYPTHSGFC